MRWDDPDADPIADLKHWIGVLSEDAAEPKRQAIVFLPPGFRERCERAGIDVQAELDAGARQFGFTGADLR